MPTPYWNGGFESGVNPQQGSAVPSAPMSFGDSGVNPQRGSAVPSAPVSFGGSGVNSQQVLAVPSAPVSFGNSGVNPQHVSAAPSAPVSFGGSGVDQLLRRAEHVHGEHRCDDRVFAMHGDLPAQARAASMNADGAGLFDKGYGRSQDLPRYGVGGGGFGDGPCPGRTYGPWTEHSGGSMNTKGELPDLPADSSPLQFGDWLHLITPIMKDISASADWWWESTLREAKVFYENWRTSSPLQRIQIQPRLPQDLQSSQFQRTEQRGIQMLLKAIPSTEQQALVTDRILSSTGIIFKLLVRFQPGGPGEKQLLLTHLTTFPKCKDIQEVASALRSWRRHFGRALEVEATLPDGVLLLKNLDMPQQKLGSMDNQAAFRLS